MRLRGEHDVVEATLAEVLHVGGGGRDELLRQREVLARVDLGIERAGVHADADGDPPASGFVDHGVHAVERADVAGVYAKRSRASARRLYGKPVVEVDVRDHGKRTLSADLAEAVKRRRVGDGDAYDLAAGLCETLYLRERGRGIVRLRGAHGLHRHGRAAADGNAPHVHLVRELASGAHAFLITHTNPLSAPTTSANNEAHDVVLEGEHEDEQEESQAGVADVRLHPDG